MEILPWLVVVTLITLSESQTVNRKSNIIDNTAGDTGPCDVKAGSLLRYCTLELATTWTITRETTLEGVKIQCDRTDPCIQITSGAHVYITDSSADGDGTSSLFNMKPNSKLTISNVRFSNFVSSKSGAVINAPRDNVVTITNSQFFDNKVTGSNGGCFYINKGVEDNEVCLRTQ